MRLSDVYMPFGKHKGMSLDDVPADYLLWLFSQNWLSDRFPEIHNYIVNNLKVIEDDAELLKSAHTDWRYLDDDE